MVDLISWMLVVREVWRLSGVLGLVGGVGRCEVRLVWKWVILRVMLLVRGILLVF